MFFGAWVKAPLSSFLRRYGCTGFEAKAFISSLDDAAAGRGVRVSVAMTPPVVETFKKNPSRP